MASQESSVLHEPQTATDQLLRESVQYSQDFISDKRTYTGILLYVRLVQDDVWWPTNRTVTNRPGVPICTFQDRPNYQ